LLHYELVEYGWAFFVLLPIVTGLSVGALPNKWWSIFGLIVSLGFTLVGLVTMGLEGAMCGLMSLGLLLPFIFLGALISHLIGEYRKIKGTTKLNILILPLFIFLVTAPFEQKTIRLNEIKTEIILPYTTEEVFDEIKSVDTLDAPKSSLMYFGLPVPYKCVLENEQVGGMRTCYFDGGKIVEQITEIERGKILRMIVTDYELIGRKWLGFKDAIYLFEKINSTQTKLTRVTTYTSELKPRFYWKSLEELGINQEHDYVFRNLEKDLKNKYGR